MHADLEAIVAADEECRSRMTLAEARSERELAAAREERDAAIARRAAAAQAALERELEAIHSEEESRLHDLREQQNRYLASLAETGERKFPDAVQIYLRIIYAPEER